MIKFFRKHTKKLLAVFMALLLVVWLGGSALEGMMSGSTSDRLIGTAVTGDIVELDQRYARMRTSLLEKLGIPWKTPIPGVVSTSDRFGVMEWILLTREAERYGIRTRRVEIDQFLSQYLASAGLPPDYVPRLAERDDVKVEIIYDAIGKFLAIRQLASMPLFAGDRSEAHVRLAAYHELARVKVNLVALRANSFIDSARTFDEDQINEHYSKYRDQQRQGGLNLGYLQPEKVKVQYLKIDVNQIAAHIRVRKDTLDKKGRDYWRRNRETPQFRRPQEPADLDPASDVQGDPQQEEPEEPASPYFESYDEAREVAVQVVRREFAQAKIEEVTGWLLRQLAEPWYGAPDGDDGYKIGPAEVLAEKHFDELLGRLPGTLRFVDAVSIHTTEHFTQPEVFTKAPDLARGTIRLGAAGATQSFRDVAFRVQGIATVPTQRGASASDYLAVGQSHRWPVTGRDGSRYVFRIIDVQPVGPPDSVEDVRDQVINDLRLLAGYEEAARLADKLALLAPAEGLKSAFDNDDEIQVLVKPPSGFFTPAPFARRRAGTGGLPGEPSPIYVSGVGRVGDQFVDACFQLGDDGQPGKIAVIPIEDNATVAIVESVESIPLRQDEYEAQRSRIIAQIGRGAISRAVNGWLDPERIRDRNGFSLPE